MNTQVATDTTTARINGDRLWASLMELAKIGATPKGGVCRLTLTDLDKQGRDLVTGWAREAGMTVTIDYTRAELELLLATARRLKAGPHAQTLGGKSIALVFFNPSLRTRTSFELGMHQLGGKAIVLEPGKGAWPIEFG